MWAASTPIKIIATVANAASDRSIDAPALAQEVSNLEKSLKPLESSFDRVENWLIGFTILVVVGLVVEYWDDIRELRHSLKERRSGISLPSHVDPIWKLIRAVAGGVLVTIGVAGELVEEFNAAHVEIRLRDMNGRIDALLELEAGTAAKQAAIATQSAAELGLKVDKLPTFVAQKEKKISDQVTAFNGFAADEKKQTLALTAELNRDKADFEKARTEAVNAAATAKQIALPRGLTDEQQREFVERMKPFAGLTVNVWTLSSSSSDAAPLANLLAILLEKAGWKVGTPSALGSAYARGVVVLAGTIPKGNVGAAAIAFVTTLRADNIGSGIDPKTDPNLKMSSIGGPLPNPDLAIVVGSKS